MWTDPVVEEIHQIRQKLLTEAGGDLNTYLAQARRRAEQGGRVVAQDIRQDRTGHVLPKDMTPIRAWREHFGLTIIGGMRT